MSRVRISSATPIKPLVKPIFGGLGISRDTPMTRQAANPMRNIAEATRSTKPPARTGQNHGVSASDSPPAEPPTRSARPSQPSKWLIFPRPHPAKSTAATRQLLGNYSIALPNAATTLQLLGNYSMALPSTTATLRLYPTRQPLYNHSATTRWLCPARQPLYNNSATTRQPLGNYSMASPRLRPTRSCLWSRAG